MVPARHSKSMSSSTRAFGMGLSRGAARLGLAWMLGVLALGCAARRAPQPLAAGGVLDLRDWDFRKDRALRLAGDWDFFPGQLLRGAQAMEAARIGGRSLPDRWKGGEAFPPGGSGALAPGMGAATYRLR